MGASAIRKILSVVGLTIALTAFLVAPAGAQDNEGNNGSIKVHEGAGEPAAEEASEPQVCTFHVHGFHYDAGQTVDYTITNTETNEVAESGSFTVNDDGEGRDPETGAMAVEDAGSYRLDATTDDGSKHKTFQVTCEGGVLGGVLGSTGGDASAFVTGAGLLMIVGAALVLRSRRRLWGTPQF